MTDVTRPIIGRLIIDTAANIPPATPKNKNITFIAEDTGEILTCDGSTWSPVGGASLPGVTSDGMNGVTAQNFTAYPIIADPTEGATITAIPWTDDGDAPLPAGDYEYAIAYTDASSNLTGFFGSGRITLDGTQLPKLQSPPSRPADAPYMAFARYVPSMDRHYRVPALSDATVPFVDFHTDDELIASAAGFPLPTYNQTYPTATLGPTTVQGALAVKAAIAEWDATPQTAQPSLIASRSDLQAQIDELVAVLVARGSVADNRTA